MPSRWYCRVLDQEWGPLSFADVAAMLRAGTLSEDDPVRRNGEHHWTPARDVVGLLHQARVAAPPLQAKRISDAASERDEPPESEWQAPRDPAPAATAHASGGTRVAFRIRRGWLLALAVAAAAAVAILFAVPRPEVFPEPQGTAAAADAGFHVPLIGRVTLLEYVLVWIDAALLGAGLVWLLRRLVLQGSRRI